MSQERPVALIHSYLKDRGGKDRPDRLTRACLVAASELKRRGEIDKVVITVTESLARPMVARLNLIGRFGENEIVVRPQTATTDDEVKTFKKMAKEHAWTNLKTIGIKVHIPRIKNSISHHFGENSNISTTSAEDVLQTHPRFAKVLEEMGSWPELGSLEDQESTLARVSEASEFGKFIVGTFPRLIPTKLKIALQSLLFRLLEK